MLDTPRPILGGALVALACAARLAAGTPTETMLSDPAGATFDFFGGSGALAGDVLVVGANVGGAFDQGAAWVWRARGSGWVAEAELGAASGAAIDAFGAASAVSGDVIVVGAHLDDVGSAVNQGSAVAFRWNGSAWTEEATLVSSGGAAGDRRGSSVAVSGDVIVVGAPESDPGGTLDQGSATVFRWSGSAWLEEQELTSGSGAAGDRFGSSVAASGDLVLVGAPRHAVAGQAQAGAATLFRWNGSTWVEEAELLASGAASGDRFGSAVTVSGDVIALGAPGDDTTAGSNRGSVRVFRWNGSAFLEEAVLIASDGESGDSFGAALALDGEVLVAGAREDDVGTNDDQGSATVFRRSGSRWEQDVQLTASQGATSDVFGLAVAVSGDRVAVGAPFDDGAQVDQGAAYLYHLDPPGADPWVDLGGGTTGSAGPPLLTMSGPLTPSSLLSLDLVDGPPAALALLFLSSRSSPAHRVAGDGH